MNAPYRQAAPPQPKAARNGSWRTGAIVFLIVVIALGAFAGAAFFMTATLRKSSHEAALAFANEAAIMNFPKAAPAQNRDAMAALKGGSQFTTSVGDTAGQFSNGTACVTISRGDKGGTPAVRTIVVVKNAVGNVVSYGLADACPCPAKLRPTSRLVCREDPEP